MRVLLAEDSPTQLKQYGAHLTKHGHYVFEMINAEDAIAAIRAYPENIDHVITDCVFGAMNGIHVAEAAQEKNIPVTMMSNISDADMAVMEEFIKAKKLDATIIQKPRTGAMLMEILEREHAQWVARREGKS